MTEQVEPPVGTVMRDEDGRVFLREPRGWQRTGSRAELRWDDLCSHFGALVELRPVAEVAEAIAERIVAARGAAEPSHAAGGGVIAPSAARWLGLDQAAAIALEYAAKEG